MNINPIITDPTDNDVYKWSMGNFLYKQGYLRETVGWAFFNRGKTKFPIGYGRELQAQVDSWANLHFTDEMLLHFEKILYWLDHYYVWAYLKTYTFDPSCIVITATEKDGYEDISVSYEGEWGRVLFFEIFLLSTMSELYNIMTNMDGQAISREEREVRTSKKLVAMKEHGVKLAEFGTRRRYSKGEQERVLKQIIAEAPQVFTGTSNAMFSRKYNLVPIGTMGHELVMFMGAKYGPANANPILMKKWVDVYNGALGIYLPDTYTTKHFLSDFDLLNSKLWDGVREDSAPDTDAYVDMIIAHYKRHRINPATKFINHSNGVSSIEDMIHMQNYRKSEIGRNFGVGTWLTNDVYPEGSGLRPVDWVVKMTHIYEHGRKRYCVKVSDSPGKITSVDEATTARYLEELGL
jgi:nicotinate phosphoribosyltransferase